MDLRLPTLWWSESLQNSAQVFQTFLARGMAAGNNRFGNMPGDEYGLNFLFAIWLWFRLTNKARLRLRPSTFVSLISRRSGLDIFKYRHIAKPYRCASL